MKTKEQIRLLEARTIPWRFWGPYLSERQWGTVREDYSSNGDAWHYFTHDQARSRAYHWGEDGLGGICDMHGVLCFALALWNGKDPILKERLFGLDNSEGNHGEDVKEYYFYLDSTPTHSYMKYLYKYPHAAFPYSDLVETNRRRSKQEREYELLDTGIFDGNRYFDVFVEYAKAAPEDVLIQITVCNRGPEDAAVHVLPHLWFRNTWSWMGGGTRPVLKALAGENSSKHIFAHRLPEPPHPIPLPRGGEGVRRADEGSFEPLKVHGEGHGVIHAHHTDPLFQGSLPDYYLYLEGNAPLLFTENETNNARLFGIANAGPYVKDGINDHVVHGKTGVTNPAGTGTKAAAHYQFVVPARGEQVIRLRLTRRPPGDLAQPFGDFNPIMAKRLKEADEFYDARTPDSVKLTPDRARILRQALAGMLWTKQYFYFDLDLWLREHQVDPAQPAGKRPRIRNHEWAHMYNDDIISMPDKWEYPWYAAWDLAFHAIALGMVDPDFSKQQLDLMLRNDYQHPNGQIPAYEWNFGDVNPPVHAWATIQLFQFDEARYGKGDYEYLKFAFSKLLVNFTWWVNRKDRVGNNCFEGGFLGLDNVGVFDRSSPLPTGGHLDQADGTAWMVFFSQQMLRIAVELALHEPLYEEFAIKFFEHTVHIAGAMDRIGLNEDEMWDEDDGFYYDVLRFPNGRAMRLKVRSMVGLLPLAAVAVFEADVLPKLPRFAARAQKFIRRNPNLCANIHPPSKPGAAGRHMVAILGEDKLRKVLARMLDENEFLSPFGIRSLSRFHQEHPYVFHHDGHEFRVAYVPGDSDSGMFGGNSNWRGPVWMPVNNLLYTALLRLYAYYGDDFRVECPTGSGKLMTLYEIARELGERLIRLFEPDEHGARPSDGAAKRFQEDPHWRNLPLFHEYFHGDNGAGLGASHQTGWTGLIARVVQLNASLTTEALLTGGTGAIAFKKMGLK